MPSGHYFDEQPGVGSQRRTVTLSLPDATFRLDTDRGVFSQERVDPGTKLLLLHAPPPPPTGDLLDLGCGAGPIAITMAHRSPRATVWAIDVNQRARELCALNARQNGIDNVVTCAPDEIPDHVRFAALWSNPPIRIGKQALHDLLLRWLGRLEPTATATLVVQRHLGADSLSRWLGDQGWHAGRLASAQGYRVLEARRVDLDAQP